MRSFIDDMKRAIFIGFLWSAAAISAILCIVFVIAAMAISAWWVIGFIICGIISGISASVAYTVCDRY